MYSGESICHPAGGRRGGKGWPARFATDFARHGRARFGGVITTMPLAISMMIGCLGAATTAEAVPDNVYQFTVLSYQALDVTYNNHEYNISIDIDILPIMINNPIQPGAQFAHAIDEPIYTLSNIILYNRFNHNPESLAFTTIHYNCDGRLNNQNLYSDRNQYVQHYGTIIYSCLRFSKYAISERLLSSIIAKNSVFEMLGGGSTEGVSMGIGGARNNAPAQRQHTTTDANQQFHAGVSSGIITEIKNVKYSKCLDILGENTSVGTPVVQYRCHSPFNKNKDGQG